jgi:integrase/recombinase XerD
VTQLRDRMLEELERRNYSPGTARCYLQAVEQFAEHFHRAPEQLGAEQIREYQLYLLRERKLSPKTVAQRTAALRVFFVKTLKRRHMLEHLPFPKLPEKLPTVLSREEVSRLLAASANRMHRTMLMTLYATGVRRLTRDLALPVKKLWTGQICFRLAKSAFGKLLFQAPGGRLEVAAKTRCFTNKLMSRR